ncbi:uncharacterized protein LOC116342541 [Contarinia nasturtii]|uniref:uncharacterized protein LOC116342541 n=1 Tax=Contarinia nasturtii TaxID=265458 RepID=UPI0012D4BD1B|nr:uncharacterized protein LOC116342541 [Contarinia nasturtii]
MAKLLTTLSFLCVAPAVVFGVWGVSEKIDLPVYNPNNAKFLTGLKYLSDNGWTQLYLQEAGDSSAPNTTIDGLVDQIQMVINTYNLKGAKYEYNVYMQHFYELAGTIGKLYQQATPANKQLIEHINQDMVTALAVMFSTLL